MLLNLDNRLRAGLQEELEVVVEDQRGLVFWEKKKKKVLRSAAPLLLVSKQTSVWDCGRTYYHA